MKAIKKWSIFFIFFFTLSGCCASNNCMQIDKAIGNIIVDEKIIDFKVNKTGEVIAIRTQNQHNKCFPEIDILYIYDITNPTPDPNILKHSRQTMSDTNSALKEHLLL